MRIPGLTNVNISKCPEKAINSLPDRMRVDGHLDASFNLDVKRMPISLRVKRSCNFGSCENLSKVSDELIVGSGSAIFGLCWDIHELPGKLIVGGVLGLESNRKLERLPDGMCVGSLTLIGSAKIEELPNSLSGRSLEILNLRRCYKLRKLPNGLNVGDLNVSGCEELDDLPDDLQVRGKLLYNDDTGFARDVRKMRLIRSRFNTKKEKR